MAILWPYFAAFMLALVLCLLLTPVVRRFALRYDFVAQPRADRWHQSPTGLLGGVGIFAAFITAWLLVSFYAPPVQGGGPPPTQQAFLLVLSAAAFFLLGLADDCLDINPQYKLVGQVVIASVMVFCGLHINWFDSMTANYMLSVFWIVGITNAFNLLDNMDGLAAGVAFIAGIFLFLWLLTDPLRAAENSGLMVLTAVYLGSLLGFLVFNFYPASIFMGDAGSMFIGFMLAGLIMMAGSAGMTAGGGVFNQLSVVLMPILILFVPILDTTFVSLTRPMMKRSIFQGGRDHSSHRMVAIGFSERKAVLLLYLFAAASGLLALVLIPLNLYISLAIIAVYLLLVLLFFMYLAHVDVYNGDPQPGFSPNHCGKIYPDPYGKTLLTILFDLILITVGYYAAYLLRFEGDIGPNFNFFLKSLPILYACQITCFYVFGLYRNIWWGSRMGDLVGYLKGVTAGTVAAILLLLFLYRFQSFSRAVFVIYWGLMLVLVTFSRVFLKVLDEGISRSQSDGRPVLVYGAGVGGQLLAREIENNHELGMCLKGFIDDNPKLHGKKIHGYPVLGGMEQVPGLIRKHGVEEIVISFKRAGDEKKKEIAGLCARAERPVNVRRMKLTLT